MLFKILLYICLFIFPFTSYTFDEKQLNRFKVIKIMSKNIKVKQFNLPDHRVAGEIRVSPGLLEAIR